MRHVQIVGPCLHHRAALLDELGTVVGHAQGVRHLVGKLVLDALGLVAKFFVQDGARHGPEAVAGDFGSGGVPHATQGCVDGRAAHWPFTAARPREYVPPCAGQGV